MSTQGIRQFLQINTQLSEQEVMRLQSAAKYAGMPWLPILARPRTARQFIRRIESEQDCACC